MAKAVIIILLLGIAVGAVMKFVWNLTVGLIFLGAAFLLAIVVWLIMGRKGSPPNP
jgi:hypothetical protein